jgi:hypothetical protein
MKTRLAFNVVSWCLFGLSVVANAGEKPTPDQQRVQMLIKLLASTNTAPEEPIHSFPPNYSRDAQVVVYLAIQQLLAEGSIAFDVLIENSNDKHYCYTYAAPDSEYNRTVGEACVLIVVGNVRCYAREIHIITEEQRYLGPDLLV